MQRSHLHKEPKHIIFVHIRLLEMQTIMQTEETK